MKSRFLVMLAIAAIMAVAGQAVAGSVSVIQTLNPGGTDAGGGDINDTITNDILLDAGAGVSVGSMQIWLNLTQGTVVEHPSNGTTPPSSALVPVFGTIAFDSFVAAGFYSDAPANMQDSPLVLGASDKLGGPAPPAAVTDPTRWDVAYGPPLGQVNEGALNWLAGRLTLSNNAMGEFRFRADFSDDTSAIIGGLDGMSNPFVIENGAIILGGGGELFPDIDVFGNGLPVGDDDITPSLDDNTDFGVVAQGSVQTRDFTITNTGDAELTLGLPAFTGPFSLVGAAPGPLAASASAILTIGLDTALLGPQSGSVSFSTDVPGLETFNFDLAGNVIPEPASLTLFGLALIGMIGLGRRRS